MNKEDLRANFLKEMPQRIIDGDDSNYAEWLESLIVESSLMPNSLTAENGAKALLCGEFDQSVEVSNPEYCGCGKCDFCLEFPETDESYIVKTPVTWVMIKDIYSTIVQHYSKK